MSVGDSQELDADSTTIPHVAIEEKEFVLGFHAAFKLRKKGHTSVSVGGKQEMGASFSATRGWG